MVDDVASSKFIIHTSSKNQLIMGGIMKDVLQTTGWSPIKMKVAKELVPTTFNQVSVCAYAMW